MNAVTFFAVSAIAVLYALLLAVGGLAAVLWAAATVISRSWRSGERVAQPRRGEGHPRDDQGPQ